MNIVSCNICGMGTVTKRRKTCNLCTKHCINFHGVQETFATSVDIFKIKGMLDNSHFDFAPSSSCGHLHDISSI